MIRYEARPPRATLTIDDPQRRNPLSAEAMRELGEGMEQAASDPEVQVIVVTGAGDRVFSAGGDLKAGFVEARGALADLLRAMRGGGKPTVARVNGDALAGGFGLAAACDLVVAVETARFGTPEINVGLWPMMITAVLQRTMPHKVVLDLMMTGRLISAERAQQLGVVSRVVAPGDLDGVIDEVVAQLASKSPAVLRLGRDAFYSVEDLDFDAALDRLQVGLGDVALTEDAAEGRAAFLEKRPPRWKGR
ncbi:MAG: enoyl-CoA hydratase/isomerase family protein [Acidimicrobiia bacterium]